MQETAQPTKVNVVCLKHGDKYGPEYVNKLFNMISRNLTLPYNFICFTDNAAGLNPDIDIRMLPAGNYRGWWWKPYIFKKGHFDSKDTNFFIDLDMVIVKNIDHFFSFEPDKFVGLEDVGRVFGYRAPKLGSAVLKWRGDNYSRIWTTIEQDPNICSRFAGDQEYIWSLYRDEIKFFPAEWIRSYKWEIRNQSELERRGGQFFFKQVIDPIVPKGTCILAFHGTPNPHDVEDPVIVDNWR